MIQVWHHVYMTQKAIQWSICAIWLVSFGIMIIGVRVSLLKDRDFIDEILLFTEGQSNQASYYTDMVFTIIMWVRSVWVVRPKSHQIFHHLTCSFHNNLSNFYIFFLVPCLHFILLYLFCHVPSTFPPIYPCIEPPLPFKYQVVATIITTNYWITFAFAWQAVRRETELTNLRITNNINNSLSHKKGDLSESSPLVQSPGIHTRIIYRIKKELKLAKFFVLIYITFGLGFSFTMYARANAFLWGHGFVKGVEQWFALAALLFSLSAVAKPLLILLTREGYKRTSYKIKKQGISRRRRGDSMASKTYSAGCTISTSSGGFQWLSRTNILVFPSKLCSLSL